MHWCNLATKRDGCTETTCMQHSETDTLHSQVSNRLAEDTALLLPWTRSESVLGRALRIGEIRCGGRQLAAAWGKSVSLGTVHVLAIFFNGWWLSCACMGNLVRMLHIFKCVVQLGSRHSSATGLWTKVRTWHRKRSGQKGDAR